jgi:uncharacterized OB-fold protein
MAALLEMDFRSSKLSVSHGSRGRGEDQRSGSTRAVRVKCPSCGRKRPVGRDACPRCGAAFPEPAPVGTEIIIMESTADPALLAP